MSGEEPVKAKYNLDKIKNKYLIIEIYLKTYHTLDELMYRMFYNDRTSRELLI